MKFFLDIFLEIFIEIIPWNVYYFCCIYSSNKLLVIWYWWILQSHLVLEKNTKLEVISENVSLVFMFFRKERITFYSRVRNKHSPTLINFLTFFQGLRLYSGLHRAYFRCIRYKWGYTTLIFFAKFSRGYFYSRGYVFSRL